MGQSEYFWEVVLFLSHSRKKTQVSERNVMTRSALDFLQFYILRGIIHNVLSVTEYGEILGGWPGNTALKRTEVSAPWHGSQLLVLGYQCLCSPHTLSSCPVGWLPFLLNSLYSFSCVFPPPSIFFPYSAFQILHGKFKCYFFSDGPPYFP